MSKKIYKIILIILSIFILAGCTASSRLAKKQPLQVKKMYSQQQSFILCIFRSDCSTCNSYKTEVSKLSTNYNIPIYYILLSEGMMEDDDMNDLIYNHLLYLETVPVTYLVKEGRTIDYFEGALVYDDLVDWLNEYGFINK